MKIFAGTLYFIRLGNSEQIGTIGLRLDELKLAILVTYFVSINGQSIIKIKLNSSPVSHFVFLPLLKYKPVKW